MYSSPGGYAGTMYRGGGLGNNPTFAGSLVGSGSASNIFAGSSGLIGWTNRGGFTAPTAANITLNNSAQNGFGLLQFGGTTASFPALKRNATLLDVRFADDSGFGGIQTGIAILNSAASAVSANQIMLGSSVALTVGAAGAGAALPATPAGYWIINVAGTSQKVPYYN